MRTREFWVEGSVSDEEVEGWLYEGSWLWVSAPVALAVLWMRANEREEVGERGPKETDFAVGLEGEGERELRGDGVAVEGGVWITPHCHQCDVVAGTHMGHDLAVVDLHNPQDCNVGYSSHSREECSGYHDE